MASNPIGDIPVIISGDFSDLVDAIDQAVSQATDGASSIADAFSVPSVGDAMVKSLEDVGDAADAASGQVTSFGTDATDAVDSLTALGDAVGSAGDVMGTAGDAADTAAGSIDTLGSSASDAAGEVENVGSSAEEAEGGLEGMAEQLTAIGEALIITEGLKEFGEEALNAYGTVQSVTIGLTALTGSAEKADDVIEQIKNLAATEPFAFPEIAPTVQKMVALGVSTEQIGTVMQAAADASAATGNAFGNVANMLDRMSLSGTANARSMATLGISTTDLGNAMNVTADEATAAFKALDQSQRVDVLATALSKFAGTAIAEAQGISGQWQIFQNQFEEVMVAVGNALTPAVSDILAFGKSVLSAVQGAVEVFNMLPGPVKEVVGALGILVGAAIPVTAGLAAIGIGLQGLNQLIPQATALWATLTGAEVAETATTAINASAHTTAGAAVAAANTEIAESSAAAATGLTAEATAAGVANEQLSLFASEGAFTAGEQLSLFTTAEMAAATAAATTETAMISLGGAVTALAAIVGGFSWGFLSANAEVSVTDKLNAMSGFAHDLGISLSFMSDASGNASGAINQLQTILSTAGVDISGLNDKFKSGAIDQNQYVLALLDTVKAQVGVQGAVDGTSISYQKFIAEQQKLIDAVANAKDNLIQAKIDLDNNTISANTYAAAAAALTKAQDALTNSTKAHTTASGPEKDSLASVNAAAAALVATYDQAEATYGKVAAAQDGSLQEMAALAIATKNLDAATTALYGHQQQQVTASNAVATATQAIYDKVSQADNALENAIQVYNGVRQATIDGTASQAAYNIAWNNLITAFQAANPQMVTAKSTIADVGAAAMKAAQADDSWTGSHGNLITVLKGGTSTQVEVADYTKQLGDAATIAATSASNLGDAYTLMDVKIVGVSGTVSTVVQSVTNLDVAAQNAAKSVGNLGPVVTNTGTDFADAEGNLQSFLGGLNNLVQVAPTATADVASFDVSMIKVTADVNTGKDAIDGYTSSMQFYGTTAQSILTPMGTLTDAINAQATAWQNDATAANNAATATANAGNAAGSATGKSGSNKGAQTFEGTTPDTLQAIQQFLSYAGTSAASLYGVTNGAFGVGIMGNPQTGQLGAGAGPQTTAQQNAGNAVIPGGFIGAAEKGPSLTGNAPPPPVYGAGSGVAGTPMVLVSNDGGSTWQDAGYGDYPSSGDVSSAVTGVATQLQNTAATMSSTSESAVSLDQAAQTLTTQINQLNAAITSAATAAGTATTSTTATTTAVTTAPVAPTTADTTIDAGAVWQGSSSNPGTGIAGSPEYAVTGSGTTQDPFQWVETGTDYAGTSFTPLNAPGGAGVAAEQAQVTANAALDPGAVWTGPQYNPATGIAGSPMYMVTGNGTTASPFQWVPSGEVYAGATFTPLNAPGGAGATLEQGAVTANSGQTSGPVWTGPQYNPATGIAGSPMYMVTGNGTSASPFQWVPSGEDYAGAALLSPGSYPTGEGYGGAQLSPPTAPTLTPAQMTALVTASGGSGAALPNGSTQAQPQLVMNVTVNNPQLSSGQNIQNVGTQLVNVIRQNASALKFSWQ